MIIWGRSLWVCGFMEICQLGFSSKFKWPSFFGLGSKPFQLKSAQLEKFQLEIIIYFWLMHTVRSSTSSNCFTMKLIHSKLPRQNTDKYHFCALFKFQIPILNVLYLLYLCLVAVICYAISLNVTFLNTKFIDFAKSDLKFPPFLAIVGLFYHFLAFFH